MKKKAPTCSNCKYWLNVTCENSDSYYLGKEMYRVECCPFHVFITYQRVRNPISEVVR